MKSMEILPSCHSFSDIKINSNERSAAPEQETGGLPCFHFPGAPAFFSAPAPVSVAPWPPVGLETRCLRQQRVRFERLS